VTGDRPDAADRHVADELPAFAAAELPPGIARTVVRHLRGCDRCRLDLVDVVSAGAALMDAARLGFAEPGELPPLQLPAAIPVGRARRPARLPLVAAAVAAALAVGGVATVAALRDRPEPGVALRALAGAPAGAAGTVRTRTDDGGRLVQVEVRGLPPAPTGAYYELWLLDPDRGAVVSLGVLPERGGRGYPLPTAVDPRYSTVDVSVEPADGDPAHSTRSILRGPLA
jgi:hypothetical protein